MPHLTPVPRFVPHRRLVNPSPLFFPGHSTQRTPTLVSTSWSSCAGMVTRRSDRRLPFSRAASPTRLRLTTACRLTRSTCMISTLVRSLGCCCCCACSCALDVGVMTHACVSRTRGVNVVASWWSWLCACLPRMTACPFAFILPTLARTLARPQHKTRPLTTT